MVSGLAGKKQIHRHINSIGGDVELLWGFVIVYNDLKNDFMGRLELDFGRIGCEFGGAAR